jgi:hypothetical protein
METLFAGIAKIWSGVKSWLLAAFAIIVLSLASFCFIIILLTQTLWEKLSNE